MIPEIANLAAGVLDIASHNGAPASLELIAPVALYTCQPATFSWTSTSPPYTISITSLSSGLESVSTTDDSPTTSTVTELETKYFAQASSDGTDVGQRDASHLSEQVRIPEASTATWIVDLSAGTDVLVHLEDAAGETTSSLPMTVQASDEDWCLGLQAADEDLS